MKWKRIDEPSTLKGGDVSKGAADSVWRRIVEGLHKIEIGGGGGEIVNEMALPLKAFRQRIDGLRFQLIENWCLLKYCQLYDKNNANFAHWGSEFLACAKNVRDFEIKGGIGKQRTLRSMFVDDYDYNQARKILVIIQDKFDIEGMTDDDQRTSVATAFAASIQDLIVFLADTSITNVKYMKETFDMDVQNP